MLRFSFRNQPSFSNESQLYIILYVLYVQYMVRLSVHTDQKFE